MSHAGLNEPYHPVTFITTMYPHDIYMTVCSTLKILLHYCPVLYETCFHQCTSRVTAYSSDAIYMKETKIPKNALDQYPLKVLE